MGKITLNIKEVKENELGSAKHITLEEGGATTIKIVPCLEWNEETKQHDGDRRPDAHFEVIEKNWGVPYEDLESLVGGTIDMFEDDEGTLRFNEVIETGFLKDEDGEMFECTITKALPFASKVVVQVESDEFEGKRGLNVNFTKTDRETGERYIERGKRKLAIKQLAKWSDMTEEDSLEDICEALVGRKATVDVATAPNGTQYGTLKKVK